MHIYKPGLSFLKILFSPIQILILKCVTSTHDTCTQINGLSKHLKKKKSKAFSWISTLLSVHKC